MTKLTETQSILLLAACRRPDRCALPLPPSLRGGAAQKVVGALLARGLLAEAEAAPARGGEARGRWSRPRPRWRRWGRSPTRAPQADSAAPSARGESHGAAAGQEPPAGRTAPRTGKMREGTKQAQLVAMLRRDEGATIAEAVEATGWQPPRCAVPSRAR